jgi:hypothetical protein
MKSDHFKRCRAGALGLALLSSIPATAAAEPTAAAGAEKPDYHVAVGAGAGVGDPGWGTELGLLAEVNARVQPLRWLGAGASFFNMIAGNNEASALKIRAIELNAEAHPWQMKWLDPFVRVGAMRVVQTEGGYGGEADQMSRWGAQGMVGVSALLGPFAVGLNARHGFTNKSWTMLGLHLEARLPVW